MSDQNFVHLHVHTEYSLLDGLSRIDKLVGRAKELGMPSLAITDHGTMFGVMDFYRACKTEGIKPIIGVESYLARRTMQDRDPKLDKRAFHMLLLAQNQTGYLNLLKIASASQLDGYYYRPRIDRDFLAAHAEGLIATSGCLAAQIPSMIMEGKDDEAREQIGWYQDVFGKENFFLELQQHDIPELETLNKWLLDYGKSNHTNVQLLATNDVHYVMESDYDPHDTLLCIQTGALKTEADRMRMSDASYHLASQDEMWRYFGSVAPEALKNTMKVAEMCDVNLDDKTYHLPVFPVPEGHDSTSYLRYLCEKGMQWRYGSRADDPVLRDRLNYELGVIGQMGFNTYFLIVWDLCQFARHADIWWNVRGSGAGSVAAYCLGITSIDPIQNSLLFERFLNPGRVSMPDIDMDFPDDRREEMIYYTARKYGEDKVAAIITFGTLGAKAAVRDVGRALNVPLEVVNQAARMIPTEPKPKPIMTYVEENPELKQLYESSPEIKQIVDTAKHLQGVNRHASTHAAGVIVADKPLVEYLPLHRPTKIEKESSEDGGIVENPLKAVTQFPMETCESIGLLKIDFLGLSTLTILRKACDLIAQYHGINYTMSNIPYRPTDDTQVNKMLKESFEMVGRGETVGVFQVEGTGMQQMLRDMRPTKFEHIIAAVSLYRPGPMEFIPQFNRRLHGEEETTYRHPLLEPILSETFGICVAGDSFIFDVATGARYRLDEVQAKVENGQFYIQGLDDHYQPSVGHVTHWIDSGFKDVYRLTLRNGSSVKATFDHRFLTEDGWKMLGELKPGNYVATPPHLIEPEVPLSVDHQKLRVLAYLIADGSLASFSAVDFVNKEPALIESYVEALESFDDIEPVYLTQIHDVTRVMTKKRSGKGTSSLLAWLRELGLKYVPNPENRKLGGCRSQEKFIPDFVFRLSNEDIAFFLAALWDCDGYMGEKLCHYKTISEKLAYDIQTLLLRLGIRSVIHQSDYSSKRGERTAYQPTVYDTAKLAELLQRHMITTKKDVICRGYARNTVDRGTFLSELKATTELSNRGIMAHYGIDRQHLNYAGRNRERIAVSVVQGVVNTLELPLTGQNGQVLWEEIVSIEPAGTQHVYDLTVAGLHNFVANNIIVHNCVYQEQIMQIAGKLFGYELGEADLMRKAVSKKKAKDLKLHRDIFLERGPLNGVDVDSANKIFDDIEFFANYGFNRAHAADYAVITCQTAYLKAHYPAEYMTALLSVHRDDITKITTFLSECRRLTIPVLAPDVNYSELDFDIQKQPDGKRGVRFGLVAIKNAGEHAVLPIIQARKEGGPFDSLEDFCHRVDLRQVQKRTLESLIKVGALDSFGQRYQLAAPESLERIMNFSVDYHKAKEIGQMSMFGGETGMTDKLILPTVEVIPDREMLNWEKELLGLYISGRPADKIKGMLAFANTADVAELKENIGSVKNAKVAGEVIALRKLVTKNGQMMAVAQVEDWHESASALDVVLFPRTWEKYQNVVQEGSVFIFSGKVDNSRGDLQLICDFVSQNSDVVVPDESNFAPPAYNEPPAWAVDENFYDEETGELPEPPPQLEPEPAPMIAPATEGAVAVRTPSLEPQLVAVAAMPPPADWAGTSQSDEAELELAFLEEAPPPPERWLMIYFQRSDDAEKDRRRLRRLHGILTKYPGKDRFSIVIEDQRQAFKMEFPNDTTSDCEELRRDLSSIVGEGNLNIFDQPQ